MIKSTLSNTKLLLSVFSESLNSEDKRVTQLNTIAIKSGFSGWNHLKECLNGFDIEKIDDIATQAIDKSHLNSLFPLGSELRDPIFQQLLIYRTPSLSHRAPNIFKLMNLFAYVCYSGVFKKANDTISQYSSIHNISKSMLKEFNLDYLSDIELLTQFCHIFSAGDTLTKRLNELEELDDLQTLGELLKLEQLIFGNKETGMVIAKEMASILKNKLAEEDGDWPYTNFINDECMFFCVPPEDNYNPYSRFQYITISLTKDGKVLLSKVPEGQYFNHEIEQQEIMETFFKKHGQTIECPIKEALEEYEEEYL